MLVDYIEKNCKEVTNIYGKENTNPYMITMDEFQKNIINMIELSLNDKIRNSIVHVARALGTTVAVATVGAVIKNKILILYQNPDDMWNKIKYFENRDHPNEYVTVKNYEDFVYDHEDYDLVIVDVYYRGIRHDIVQEIARYRNSITFINGKIHVLNDKDIRKIENI